MMFSFLIHAMCHTAVSGMLCSASGSSPHSHRLFHTLTHTLTHTHTHTHNGPAPQPPSKKISAHRVVPTASILMKPLLPSHQPAVYQLQTQHCNLPEKRE